MVDEQSVADFFKAIGHPTRISILRAVYNNNLCVSDISGILHLNQPNTSQHLSILKDRRILKKTKRGNEVCYRIRDESIMDLIGKAEKIIGDLERE